MTWACPRAECGQEIEVLVAHEAGHGHLVAKRHIQEVGHVGDVSEP